MIEKTLSLKIVRPFYPEEVEKVLEEQKKASKEGHVSYHSKFWKKLKEDYPDIVTWEELGELLVQLQKSACEAYNEAISKLYKTKIIDKERGTTEKFLSSVVYPEFYKRFKSAYIASGLRQKVKSNFREKELRRMKVSLPTARADSFPIPFWFQEGIAIEKHNDDFIIALKFPKFERKKEVDKYRPWEKFDFVPRKTTEIKFILSTKRRRKNKSWFSDFGTDAEIRKLMNGDYEKEWSEWIKSHSKEYKKNKTKHDNAHKISWIEIVKRKNIGFGRGKWFINFTIKIPPREDIELDKKIVGGIDVGVKSPLVCAVSNSPARRSIDSNEIYQHNRRMHARMRRLGKQSFLKRAGHGKNNKLKPKTMLTDKSDAFRKKIIERWAMEVTRFFINSKAGIVQMEDLGSMVKREDDFFNAVLRTSWPYAKMQSQIENKLKEHGIELNYVKPAYTSQICSKCGEWKENFSFKDRQSQGFPSFKCDKCEFEENADYNAAKNLTKLDIEKIAKKAEKVKKASSNK